MSDPSQIPFNALAAACYCTTGYRAGECECCKAIETLRAAAALARPHKDAHETEWGKAMIHTVEQLSSRIAELEQRLEACGKYRHEADERQADLEAQLAAALARQPAGNEVLAIASNEPKP